MNSAPLNHLLKIGSEVLQTTAQTLSAAINELVSSKADVSAIGEYTASKAPVNRVVTFSDLNPDYGYDLYVDIPDETSSLPTNLIDLPVCKYTKIQRSTKADGTITLAYTVTNTNINYCLRIKK